MILGLYTARGRRCLKKKAETELIEEEDATMFQAEELAAFAKEHEVDLTVVGMDDPLVGGVVDVFEKEGLRVFGPRKMRLFWKAPRHFQKI